MESQLYSCSKQMRESAWADESTNKTSLLSYQALCMVEYKFFTFADSITVKITPRPPPLVSPSQAGQMSMTVSPLDYGVSLARGLAQHGGPPGRLEPVREWPGRCDFVCDGRAVSSAFSSPVALTRAAQLWADGISSCRYKVNLYDHPSRATPCKKDMAWYSSGPILSLWVRQNTLA